MNSGVSSWYSSPVPTTLTSVAFEGFVLYAGGDYALYPNIMLLVQVMGCGHHGRQWSPSHGVCFEHAQNKAKVRRSDLERGENAVGSRRSWAKRRNISIDVVHAQYTRGKDAAKMVTFAKAISWGLQHDHDSMASSPRPRRFHHLFRVHHHARRYPELANTTPNVYCAVWLHNDPLEISEKFDPLNI